MKYSRYTKNSEISFCFGIFPVIELLENHPLEVEGLIMATKASSGEGIEKIKQLAVSNNIPLVYDDSQLQKIINNESIVVVGVYKKYISEIDKYADHLVLVNPSDMGNVGTIFRTSLAFGIKNIVIIKPAVDIYDPKVVRASMGSIFKLNVSYFDSFEDYIFSGISGRNYYLFMTDGDQSVNKVTVKKPFSVVFGNEGQGLAVSYKNYGETVYIPQTKDVDSLNLAISVGIGLFLFNR